MNNKVKFLILTQFLVILFGFALHQYYKIKPSDMVLESTETFGKDRYIIKMKDSAVLEIFNNWDTTLFTHCEIKEQTFEVTYAPERDKIALNSIIGGESHVVDTIYFKIDKDNFRFIFKRELDTAFIPVRVLTQFYNSQN